MVALPCFFAYVFGLRVYVFYKADRVEELREGAEVEYLRKVAAVKGESLLGLSDYR